MAADGSISPAPTGMVTRRAMLIGGALACASGVAFVRRPAIARPAVSQRLFESWVPARIGEWRSTASGEVLLPPPDTLRDRLYDNLVTRTYAAPGLPPVMLLLAYNNAQSGVVQAHRPEVCYPVGGYALSDTRPIAVVAGGRSIPANFFTASGPSRLEQVEYFTRMGSAFPRSWAEQRLAVVRANLDGVIPDGMLMRVSVLGLDPAQAEPLLDRFMARFIDAGDPRLRALLLGSPNKGEE